MDEPRGHDPLLARCAGDRGGGGIVNAQIARAEKAAAGKAPLARTRFLKVAGATKELD
jgi:hypothetical protein